MAVKEFLLWCVVLVCVSADTKALGKPPKVQVYSRYPASTGKENTLHCFVENFHPPKINVTLLKDNVEIPDVQRSDLSFKEDWTFQLLSHVFFVFDGDAEYSCRVEHQMLPEPLVIKWEQY